MFPIYVLSPANATPHPSLLPCALLAACSFSPVFVDQKQQFLLLWRSGMQEFFMTAQAF